MWSFKKKKKPGVKRQYDAAAINRLLADWISSPASADAEIYGDIAKVRERARALERNESYVEKYLFELENNIIGDSGIALRSTPRDPNTGEIDKIARDAIQYAWKQQQKIQNYTVTKKLCGTDTDRLVLRSIARDGECIIRIVKGYDNQYNFAIQVIEADQLDHQFNGKWNGNEIRMGVELNEWKVPVAYWIDSEHPGDYYASYRSNGKTRMRLPAEEIVFPFRPLRAGQTRGMSWLVTSMKYLKMLGGYEEAELVAARVAASKMAVLYTDGTDYGQVDPNNPDEPFTMSAEPGLIEQLPAGMKLEMWNPQHPTTAFEGFRKAILRGIASGMNVSYNTLANDLENVNYSSLRGGKITERDGYKVIQNWFINGYKQPIFLAWLEHALDIGMIKAANGTGFPLPFQKLDKFSDHSFIPRRWQWVDPSKDAKAFETMRLNNWTTDADIIAEQGKEINEVYSQIAADKELRESFGINNNPEPAFGGQENSQSDLDL